jgi:GT2 family glycosyltransferase
VLPVYVIHWNAPRWCESAVASVEAAGTDVTVIHNGGARPEVHCRVIDHPENGGYTAGANIALREFLGGSAAWCVVASHDLHVESDAFTRMLSDAQPGVGIVGPTFVDHHAVNDDGISGACMMISRDCAERIGEFDERYGSYLEDVDYCMRARDAGFALVRSAAIAWTLGSRSTTARRRVFTNQVLLLAKRDGRRAAARRWVTHLKEAAYRATHGDWSRARDHISAFVRSTRFVARSTR